MDHDSVSLKLAKSASASDAEDRAARIRSELQNGHESLLRTFVVLVANSNRQLSRREAVDEAAELLHEAVHEALKHSDAFDPSRSATAWVRGIGARLLLNRQRTDARARRCIAATSLREEVWEAALMKLCSASTEAVIAGRLDLEGALGRLSPTERLAIELRYYRGLDGEQLASALGVPTAGAARVRVFRALQSLRTLLAATAEEAST